MALPNLPKPKKVSNWTDEHSYTEGVFDISQIPIRYFLASIPLSSLKSSFTLVEDIPGSENWGYNAIFQREIDEARVKDELLSEYLLVPNKFKFFNPITIALLPFKHGEQTISDSYRGTPKTSTTPEGYISEEIDGIVLTKSPDLPFGNIKWDKNKIIAAAIDGQHRLCALMQLAEKPPHGIHPDNSKIPVIILLFSLSEGTILKQVREIFVDINKSAKPISQQRAILLDDRNIFAIMARDL